MRLRKFLRRISAGRRLPEYKYSDVFSAQHVFKYADLIRKQLRVDTIDVLQFHVWVDRWTDEPEFRSTVEKLKRDGVDSVLSG